MVSLSLREIVTSAKIARNGLNGIANGLIVGDNYIAPGTYPGVMKVSSFDYWSGVRSSC